MTRSAPHPAPLSSEGASAHVGSGGGAASISTAPPDLSSAVVVAAAEGPCTSGEARPFQDEVVRFRQLGYSVSAIAARFDVSGAKVYRALRRKAITWRAAR